MTTHILALAGPRDRVPGFGRRDVLRLRFDAPGHPDAPIVKVPDVFARNGVVPSPTALDLLRLAIAVYAADTRIRRADAFDGWTRDIALHAFVHDPAIWLGASSLVEELLAFLTGDHWTVSFRPPPASHRPAVASPGREPRRVRADSVCLLSGGLDSFVGAIDLLEGGGTFAFVGHESQGSGATSHAQGAIEDVLVSAYGRERVPYLHLFVSPPHLRGRRSESSTRSRSLLFFGLAVATASGVGANRIVVPENGFISLNVPLTPSRLGSLSTRTTHPHLITLLGSLLSHLGIGVALDLPYRFQTKGELLRGCANRDVLARGLPLTVSCSHTEAGRYRGNPNLQCGRCVPCIVRRAAISVIGSDPTAYDHVDLAVPPPRESGIDLRVLRYGLARYKSKPPTLADVLVPGPLEGPAADLPLYTGVFARGLAEIRSFFDAGRDTPPP